ncbi:MULTISPECIES: hypothetical protein [unclassified Endozoicomonas]|uniref:hypothetical protein n=1 Tax=unclassified Endozoicomonas TaxID=2644528 RepID=UPI002149284D|nr:MULTISPECIES: hypothetical protein [unclassified Endozoicomonas]
MYIFRLITCAFLTVVIICSKAWAWAGATQIESYSSLKSALEQGELSVTGVIDLDQCTDKWPLFQSLKGKKMTVFKQNNINEDGSIVMSTSYKVSTHLVLGLRDVPPEPEWVVPAWTEWQIVYTLSEEDDGQFKIKSIATDAKTGVILRFAHYRCQLGSAIRLWHSPHGR